MPDLSDQIEDAAGTPKAAMVDGRSATARDIDDLIKADEYLEQKQARSRSTLPIRLAKISPPGSV